MAIWYGATDLVVALIGAANRDPTRYEQPDRLDITRRQGGSLSFGSGPHVCIGAALTLMEAEILFRELLRRWPRLHLIDPRPRWNGNAVYRGLTELPVQHITADPAVVASPNPTHLLREDSAPCSAIF